VQELPQVMGKAFGALAQYLGELGEQPAGPPFVAYHNMDMQDLDLEIGFPVSKRLSGRDDIGASEIPGGRAATCVHAGPYDEIKGAYTALGAWMKENGHQAAGVAYEVYLNDPASTPPPELLTRILFPLQSAE
jgi:effector-binding domain-containing protein